jgi:predicted nuclease of predicted toxin-antitoxin system
MLRLLADENLNNNIVRALQMREPWLDIVRVQDIGLTGQDDPTILEWAAKERRLVVTHDAATMTRYAYARVAGGEPMPGVVEVAVGSPLSVVIDDLLLLATASEESEWEGQVIYVPLR